MRVEWWKIANVDEFKEAGIPQRTLNLNLEDKGQVEIALLNGVAGVSVIFDGYVLTPYMNGRNAFFKNDVTCFIDSNMDIWVGNEVNS